MTAAAAAQETQERQEAAPQQQEAITHSAPDAEATENRQTEAAAPVRLTHAEVEYLMSLCLITLSGGNGSNSSSGASETNNDALLGKLANAWRRHYRMA
jgi:hypothetical protein